MIHLLLFSALLISDWIFMFSLLVSKCLSVEDTLAFLPSAVITLIIGPTTAGAAWLLDVRSGVGPGGVGGRMLDV